MLTKMKDKKKEQPASMAIKNHFYVTGYLCSPVTKGKSAEYVYHGNTVQTSSVVRILTASEEFITFETLNSIYTISYIHAPSENYGLCA